MLDKNLTGMVIAFDYGLTRIGLAGGEIELKISHPLATINEQQTSKKFQLIQLQLSEWKPSLLVVGIPFHLDGSPNDFTQTCIKFANRLFARFELPVFLVDERLSSVYAATLLKENNVHGKQQKQYLDQVAALAILESFFNNGYYDFISDKT